jgi:hypothetical protein
VRPRVIAYHASEDDDVNVYFTYSTDGQSFAPPRPITPSTPNITDQFPDDILIDPQTEVGRGGQRRGRLAHPRRKAGAMRSWASRFNPRRVADDRQLRTAPTTSPKIASAFASLTRKYGATSRTRSRFWALSTSEMLSDRPSPHATGFMS